MFKRHTNIILLSGVLMILAGSCKKLNVTPPNILDDQTILGTTDGVTSYMARLYSEMPMEDFKWSPTNGYNGGYYTYHTPNGMTGEAMSRDQRTGQESANAVNWSWVYSVIRDANYFIQYFPTYSKNFSATQVQNWLGEAYF